MISSKKCRRGFTLVEIMIVVAIIALLAAVATPNFLRARKRAQATRIMNDMRMIDYAIDRYTVERNKTAGETLTFEDLRPYLKEGLLTGSGTDLLGNPMGPYTVDANPKISTATFDALSDAAPASFWSPYY